MTRRNQKLLGPPPLCSNERERKQNTNPLNTNTAVTSPKTPRSERLPLKKSNTVGESPVRTQVGPRDQPRSAISVAKYGSLQPTGSAAGRKSRDGEGSLQAPLATQNSKQGTREILQKTPLWWRSEASVQHATATSLRHTERAERNLARHETKPHNDSSRAPEKITDQRRAMPPPQTGRCRPPSSASHPPRRHQPRVTPRAMAAIKAHQSLS